MLLPQGVVARQSSIPIVASAIPFAPIRFSGVFINSYFAAQCRLWIKIDVSGHRAMSALTPSMLQNEHERTLEGDG